MINRILNEKATVIHTATLDDDSVGGVQIKVEDGRASVTMRGYSIEMPISLWLTFAAYLEELQDEVNDHA